MSLKSTFVYIYIYISKHHVMFFGANNFNMEHHFVQSSKIRLHVLLINMLGNSEGSENNA